MQHFTQLIPRISKTQAKALVAGLGLGVLLFGLIRFMTLPTDVTHYHANFGVFINGKRMEFTAPQHYEEVASCSATEKPQGRVHMHDNIGHVVHVHEKLMTWSNFFSIIGLSLTDKSFFDGQQAYIDGQDGRLKFVLNGKPVLSLANEVIQSEDRLLITFGAADQQEAERQFAAIKADAAEYNKLSDPSACRGPEKDTVWTRLRKSFWF